MFCLYKYTLFRAILNYVFFEIKLAFVKYLVLHLVLKKQTPHEKIK
jgi:hypothetical protein